tara:strand:- start:3057 stop:3704 length:648 start_codon:yes stop_codon:yes gene_type:complete
MDPITQRILEQRRAITQDPNFSGYIASPSNLDQDIMNMQTVPNGLAAIKASQVAPVNENNLLQDTYLPEKKPVDLKGAALNIGKKLVTDYAIKELGLNTFKGNLLKGALGTNLMGFSNPVSLAFTAGSLLPDSVKGLSGLLRGKRAEKAIARNILKDSQGDIKTINMKTMNMQPTPQDIAMGDGGKLTGPPKKPTKSYTGTNPYSGGVSGVHSNF